MQLTGGLFVVLHVIVDVLVGQVGIGRCPVVGVLLLIVRLLEVALNVFLKVDNILATQRRLVVIGNGIFTVGVVVAESSKS